MLTLDLIRNGPILNSEDSDHDEQGDFATVVRTKPKRPPLFKVLLHNDDYTTMEFVVMVLQKHFGKTVDQAQEIMLLVHHHGLAVCGIYTREVAETKVEKVKAEAKKNEHPLLCTYEPE